MERIKKFAIEELSLSGFKRFDEQAVFHFGMQNIILGHNRQGKSSIADAIAFAITGTDFWGSGKIDSLYPLQGTKDIQITMIYVDENGRHELCRQRRNDKMYITLDGAAIRQKDLDLMFGQKEVFLSMLNPQYFIALGNSGRELLMQQLPQIPDAEVIAQLPDEHQKLLTGMTLSNPTGLLQVARQKGRDCEDAITHLEGRLLQSDVSAKGQNERAVQAQEAISALSERERILKEKQFADLDIEQLKAELTAKTLERMQLEQNPDTSEVDAAIGEKNAALKRRQAEEYQPKYAEATKKERNMLYLRGAVLDLNRRFLTALAPNYTCPLCHQVISEDEVDSCRQKAEKALPSMKESLAAQKEKLAEVKTLEQKSEAVFQQYKADDTTKLTQELKALEDQRQSLFRKGHPAMMELNPEIAAIQTQLAQGALSDEEFEELSAIPAKLSELKVKLEAYSEGGEQAREELEEKLKHQQVEKEVLSQRVTALVAFINRRYELLFANLSMNRVEISLFDVVKSTGEVKEAFRFEYEGRPYHVLSASEKTQAGMEVTLLMGRLTCCTYPVFIDNAEGILELTNAIPVGQAFMARVERNMPLTVRVMDVPSAQMQTAA